MADPTPLTQATNAPAGPLAPAQTGAWLTFGLDRVEWLQGTLLGNPVWQYVASLLYIVLAFYAAKLVDCFFRTQLRKATSRTQTQTDDLLLELARGPVKIITFVILMHIGLRVFAWPEWAAVFISKGLKLVVACSITYVALKAVDLAMGLWERRITEAERGVLDMQLLPVICKTIKAFVIMVAVLVTFQNLGVNVTGLLASLSIGGLAVGLAAQDTLSNLFGAVALFTDRPFRMGDRVQFDQVEGTVESIGMRSTRIRNLEGYLVAVPNRTMANACITNISRRPNIKTTLNLGLTYDTPADKVERALAILDEIFKPHPRTADLVITFNKFKDSSLNVLVEHWWAGTDFREYAREFQQLNLELKRRFDAAGIEFAFPTQTVHVKGQVGESAKPPK